MINSTIEHRATDKRNGGKGPGAAETVSNAQRENGRDGHGVPSLARALVCVFNVVALNLLWVATSLPLVTVPNTTAAAFGAIDMWLSGADDRVARNFMALLPRRPGRTWVNCGLPLALIGIGVCESAYFAVRDSTVDRVCLGISIIFLACLTIVISYILYLAVTTGLNGPSLWCAAAWFGVRNMPVTGPLSLVVACGGVLLAVADPSLCVVVVPAAVMFSGFAIAKLGVQRGLAGIERYGEGSWAKKGTGVVEIEESR